MTIIRILLALLLLGFIVLIHEAGHYCAARLLHIPVAEFSIGFGPAILKWKKNNIQYSLRIIFCGGYVRFYDDDVEDKSFNKTPVWKRFITLFSGPFMNFVLAFIAALVMVLLGYIVYQTVPQVGAVTENTPAYEAGLCAGDIITEINGTPLTCDSEGYYTMLDVISQCGEDDVLDLVIDRNGEKLELTTALYPDAETGRLLMGITVATRSYIPPFGEAVGYAFNVFKNVSTLLIDSLKALVFHGEGVEDISGTVGVVSVMSQTIMQGWDMVLYLVLIISANLGIMNLLPLPALDGGRLVFLIVEAIRRKPIPPEKEGMVHAIGLGLFFLLFIFLTYHDIVRIVTGGM